MENTRLSAKERRELRPAKTHIAIGFAAVLFLFSKTLLSEEIPVEDKPNTTLEFAPGSGVDIRSANRDFRLNIKVFGQMLYTATLGDGPTSKGDMRGISDAEQSLALRRARLVLSGNLFGEHNKYYVQLAFSPQDMGFKNGTPTNAPFFDWYFKFDYLRDLNFQVGQYRIPFSKSRVIPYAKLQFVDRALPNFEFNLDRDIGLDIRSDDFLGLDLLRYYAGVFIGEGRDGYGASDFGMVYVARLEIHPLGLFQDYVEADLERRDKPALALGVAYAFLDDAKYNRGILGKVPSDGGTSDIHTVTADIAFKWAGVSLTGELYARKAYRDDGDVQAVDENGDPIFEDDGVTPFIDREMARNGLGWFAQMGWMVPGIPVEIAGRYGQVHPLFGDSHITRLDEIGAGINWYVFGPSMAVKMDYHHRFRGGTLDDATDEVRVSFQAGF